MDAETSGECYKQSRSHTLCLSSLPPEVLVSIIGFNLSEPSKLGTPGGFLPFLRLVCKTWRRLHDEQVTELVLRKGLVTSLEIRLLESLPRLSTVDLRGMFCSTQTELLPILEKHTGLVNLSTDIAVADYVDLTKWQHLTSLTFRQAHADTLMENLQPLTRLVRLVVKTCKGYVSDCLSRFGSLTELDLTLCVFRTPCDMEALRSLTRLEGLTLRSCGVRDKGVKVIEGLVHLKRLDFSNTFCVCEAKNNITCAGLQALQACTALTRLELSRALNLRLTADRTAGFLSALTNLEHLGLRRCSASDHCLPVLRHLKKLRSLDLSFNYISGTRLAALKSLDSLTHLNLSCNWLLAPDTLNQFQHMQNLVELNLERMPNFAAVFGLSEERVEVVIDMAMHGGEFAHGIAQGLEDVVNGNLGNVNVHYDLLNEMHGLLLGQLNAMGVLH